MSAEGYRWMVASLIGMFLGFGGLYFASNSNLKSQSTAPAATLPQAMPQASPVQPAALALQPIIIYLPAPGGEKK